MQSFVLFGSFALMLLLTVPVGVSLGLSVIFYLAYTTAQPIQYFVTVMFTACDSFPLLAIPFFILAGALMDVGGLSKRLVDFVDTLVGHFTGGYAIVTILACMFFGAISGSAPATVAAIGSIMLPVMVDRGYDRPFCVALIASAGILGVIVPPSIPMVMYGVATGASVGDLFVGGLLPAVVVGTGLAILSMYYAKKRGYKGNGKKFSIKRVLKVGKEAFWALLVPVIILGGIYGGIFTPTEAAVVSVVYAFIVGKFIYKQLDFSNIYNSFRESAITIGTILIIVGTGTALGRILTIEGYPQAIQAKLLSISDKGWVVLLVINLILLVVGMIMDTTAANLILSPIFYPVVAAFGVDIIHFGLIMVVNLAIGFVTPPVGINLFIACNIGEVKFSSMIKQIIPFVAVLFAAQMIITYVPFLSTWLPSLLRG